MLLNLISDGDSWATVRFETYRGRGGVGGRDFGCLTCI